MPVFDKSGKISFGKCPNGKGKGMGMGKGKGKGMRKGKGMGKGMESVFGGSKEYNPFK